MKLKISFNLLIAIGFIFGAFFGITSFPFCMQGIEVIKTVFINLLKLISLPMIFLAILSTFSNLENIFEARNFLRRIFGYTLLTTLLSATTALLLFLTIKPGAASLLENLPQQKAAGSYLSFLVKIIPSNPVEPFLENNVLGVAFMSLLLSVAILYLPKEQKRVLEPIFKSLFQLFLKISKGILFILPFGVMAFAAEFFQDLFHNGLKIGSLFLYILCVIGANLIQGFVILPLLLKRKGISPLSLAKAFSPAIVNAFFTKSSNSTLPLALECAIERAQIKPKTANMAFPLCSVINMNGCAAFILITVLFVSMQAGHIYSPMDYIMWIFIATLAAIGNAGIPMGCFFLTGAFLTGMHVPLNLLGLILPVYTLFDMVETALNVWSDCCVCAMLDRQDEKIFANS